VSRFPLMFVLSPSLSKKYYMHVIGVYFFLGFNEKMERKINGGDQVFEKDTLETSPNKANDKHDGGLLNVIS